MGRRGTEHEDGHPSPLRRRAWGGRGLRRCGHRALGLLAALPALRQAGFLAYRPRGAYYIMTDISAFGFPDDLRVQIEHLVLSHHGAKALGSPVDPMTVEAFILAAADDLDARIHQVRRHIDADDTDGPFTAYHRRLDRVLYKGPRQA